MAGPYQAVVFDMDGLLLDSERPIMKAWLQASLELGMPVTEEVFLHVVGRTEPDTRAHFADRLGERYPYDEVRRRVKVALDLAHGVQGYDVKAGVLSLLMRLQLQGVPCAVASSTRREEVVARLTRAGLAAYFQMFTGGDEVQRGKPHPDIYLLAAQRLGIDPTHCLAFEDSDHGAQAALAAGMDVVIVPDLKHPDNALRQRAAAVLASMADAEAHHTHWFG